MTMYLFLFVELAFVTLLSGTVCVYGSSPIFSFGVVNYFAMIGKKGRFILI